jgi:hypothetical protein
MTIIMTAIRCVRAGEMIGGGCTLGLCECCAVLICFAVFCVVFPHHPPLLPALCVTKQVDQGGMTGRGMEQMYALGEFLRARYVAPGFLSPHYSETEVYFRASGATRCMQSAQAVGFALYPQGTAPPGMS